MSPSLRVDGLNLMVTSPSGAKRVGAIVPFQGHFSFWVDPSCLQVEGILLPDAAIRYIASRDVDRIYAYHAGHGLIYKLKSNHILFTMAELKVDGGMILPYSQLTADQGRGSQVPHVPEKYSEVID